MRAFPLLAFGLLVLAGCSSPPDQEVLDSDGDGLDDATEGFLGTNPRSVDTDGDGVSDRDEILRGRDPTGPDPVPRVVVADIDTGINVYHERFLLPGGIPEETLAFLTDANNGQAPVVVNLTMSGTFAERLEADQATWDAMERGVLYYFAGTRVLGISFEDDAGDENPVLDFPDGSHGTATAGAVVDANPDAYVVMVEGVGNNAGEMWAMSQPWIDVTTMSYGPVGSPPTSSLEETGTHAATHAGWRAGKLPVGAADNTPSLSPNDATAGPPWVIGVAGDHVETRCRDHVSGTFPDVTANFTQVLPTADSIDERRSTSGTSFATPTTAGTLSAAVLEIRRLWDHRDGIVEGALAVRADGVRLDNGDVRDAMNATAYYFGATECQPEPGTSAPVVPGAPWLQMGWGHVGPEIVGDMVVRLNETRPFASPLEKTGARAFQEALYDYRVRLWGEV